MATESSTSVGRGSRRALPVLLASATLVVMSGAVISPVVTLIRGQFGLSPGQAGLVITMHALFIAITSPFVGILIDKVGTRWVLLAGLLAYGVFGGAGALATSYPLLLVARAAFGVAAAGVATGLTTSLLTLWQGRARDTVLGYRATATSVGGIIWPILGGALGSVVGWQGPFAVYLIALPIAAAAVWMLPDSRATADRSSGADSAATLTMRYVVRRTRILLWLYALVFLLQLLLYAIVTFLPQRLTELGMAQPLLISVFLAVTNVTAAAAGLLYARIRRRLSYRQIFLTGFALPMAAFAVLTLATQPWLLLLGPVLFGLSLAPLMAAIPARIGEAVPEQARGRATSYMSSLLMLGQFVAPLILGPLSDGAFGIRTVFLGAGIISALATIAIAAAFHPDCTTLQA